MSNEWISVACPHCGGRSNVQKQMISFGLFRHMIYKKNNCQVPPHTDQKVYDDLIKRKQVSGCYLPYMVYIQDDGSVRTIKCSYM